MAFAAANATMASPAAKLLDDGLCAIVPIFISYSAVR
jgi:hypothetical protein